MRWDFFLFSASAVIAALGDWGVYIGVVGMTLSVVHGALKAVRTPKRRRMVTMLGLLISGAAFAGLLVFSLKPDWFGLQHPAPAAKAEATSDVSFQKLSIFCVQIDKDVYQVGVIIKLFNLDTKPYLINGIGFSGSVQNAGGRVALRHTWGNTDRQEFLEDNYIRASAEGHYKWLLPLKYEMIVMGGTPPGFVLLGPWRVILGDKRVEVTPQMYANYDRIISLQEWNDLLKPASKINLDNLHYVEMPVLPEPGDGQMHEYILFNPDRTATIEIWGFAQTPTVSGEKGAMLMMRGIGNFNLPGAWQVLGHSYPEVWADPKKLELYNSIFPPDKEGKPRPFGVFM